MQNKLNNKKISIIMGIYNCGSYLPEALDSIISQTYTNWELIMCDDSSLDDTYNIAKKYATKYPSKIKLLKNDKNLKLNKTLNRCLDIATGEYIARMDGDDICHPTRLEKEVDFLNRHKKYALVSCQMDLFNSNGVFGQAKFPKGEVEKTQLLYSSPFCHAGMLMRADVLKSLGGYSESKEYLRVEDYDLWYRLYLNGHKGYNLSEVLYSMRDDESAYARRNWVNRYNEYLVKKRVFKSFKLPYSRKINIYRPIVLFFMPKFLYKLLRKRVVAK